MAERINKSDKEWREQLTPEQYEITRKKGTERPFSGRYYDLKSEGVYRCVCCGNELFSSDAKFDTACGWPSFWAPVDKANVCESEDMSYGLKRVEVTCDKCGAHLGHVFTDGPKPTGLRYCINSASLDFKEGEKGRGKEK